MGYRWWSGTEASRIRLKCLDEGRGGGWGMGVTVKKVWSRVRCGSLKNFSKNILKKGVDKGKIVRRERGMSMIKIFQRGQGWWHLQTPSPPTNNFCLYPPPVLRRFRKDSLMTTPTTPLQASFTATPSPSITPSPLKIRSYTMWLPAPHPKT